MFRISHVILRTGSGCLDFDEFFLAFWPSHFSKDVEWQYGQAFHGKWQGGNAVRGGTDKFASEAEIVRQIQEKVLARGHRSSGQTGPINSKDRNRHAYLMFGRPRNGVSKSLFQKTLENIGVCLSADQWTTVFRKFDNGAGVLDFQKFTRDMLPNDYPADCRGSERFEDAFGSSDADQVWWKTKKPDTRVALQNEGLNLTVSSDKVSAHLLPVAVQIAHCCRLQPLQSSRRSISMASLELKRESQRQFTVSIFQTVSRAFVSNVVVCACYRRQQKWANQMMTQSRSRVQWQRDSGRYR